MDGENKSGLQISIQFTPEGYHALGTALNALGNK